MFGYIYKITNLLNNKIYIGKHKYDKPELDNSYITGGVLIRRSISKYGIEHFSREIIDSSAESEDELNSLEIRYIKEFNCKYPNGYNLAPGGEGVSEVLPVTRENMKKAAQERTKTCPPPSQKNGVWVFNGTEEHLIQLDALDEYLALGYSRGRKPDADKIARARDKYKNGSYVNKDGKEIFIDNKDLDNYINNGYSVGKLPYPKERGKNISRGKKGAVAITDGEKTFYISPDSLDEYLSKGYFRGTYQRYQKTNQ